MSAPDPNEVPMLFLLSFAISAILATLAYAQTRNFVTRRLRYVDAVQSALAPIVTGVAVAVLCLPIVAFLPLVGLGTALSVGFAVGAGVASGAREVRRKLPGY